MKLNEVYSRPLKEVVEEMELSEMKVHTDDNGVVKTIELKYSERLDALENDSEIKNPFANL